jgi:Flp pilus assembly protein TadB
LAEKGLPVPPELLARPPRATGNRDLRSGLILIGLGIGLVIFFTEVAPAVWAIGLIPGLIGVAFLVSWAIERKLPRERDPNDR